MWQRWMSGKWACVPFALVDGFCLIWILAHAVSVATAVGFIALAGVAAEFGVVVVLLRPRARPGKLSGSSARSTTQGLKCRELGTSA